MNAIFFSNKNYPLYPKAKKIVEKYFTIVYLPTNNDYFDDFDVVISIFNSQILDVNFLSKPNVNIHAAPKWHRGFGGLASTIYYKKMRHGVVSHAMTADIDSGLIYKTIEFEVEKDIKFDDLLKRTEKLALYLLEDYCKYFIENGKAPKFTDEKWEGKLWTKKELKKWLDSIDFPEKKSAMNFYFGVY